MPLYARITIDKKRTEFAIKRWIEPANWDEKKNKALGKKTLAKELNDYIASIRSQVYQHHRSLL